MGGSLLGHPPTEDFHLLQEAVVRPHSIPELSLTDLEYSLLHYPENGPEPMDSPIHPLSLDHALPGEGTEGLRRGMDLESRYPALLLAD